MELVVIAFLGTLALTAVELRDAIRRLHNDSATASTSPAVPDRSHRSVLQHPVTSAAGSYSEAA